jgi:hypothetical protein
MPVMLDIWEAEIGKVVFPGYQAKKFVKPHLNRKKLGVMVYICHPNNSEKCKIGEFQDCLGRKARSYLKNN